MVGKNCWENDTNLFPRKHCTLYPIGKCYPFGKMYSIPSSNREVHGNCSTTKLFETFPKWSKGSSQLLKSTSYGRDSVFPVAKYCATFWFGKIIFGWRPTIWSHIVRPSDKRDTKNVLPCAVAVEIPTTISRMVKDSTTAVDRMSISISPAQSSIPTIALTGWSMPAAKWY